MRRTPASPAVAAEGELPGKFSDSDVFRVQASMVQQCEDLMDRILTWRDDMDDTPNTRVAGR